MEFFAGGVDDDLVVDEADTDGAHRAVPGDVADGEGGGGGVYGEHIGIVDTVDGEDVADDLGFVVVAGCE